MQIEEQQGSLLQTKKELIVLELRSNTVSYEVNVNAVRLRLTDFKLEYIQFCDNNMHTSLESLLVQWGYFIEDNELVDIELFVCVDKLMDSKGLANILDLVDRQPQELILEPISDDTCETYLMLLKEKQASVKLDNGIKNLLNQMIEKEKILSDPQYYNAFILSQFSLNDYVKIDYSVVNALNLMQTKENGLSQNTVFDYIKQFIRTYMGERLLKRWILMPSQKESELKFRYTFVKLYIENTVTKKYLREFLGKMPDLDRLIVKMTRADRGMRNNFNLADGYKLYVIVRQFIELTRRWEDLDSEPKAKKVLKDIEDALEALKDFARLIETSIDLQRVEETREYFVSPNFSPRLQEINKRIIRIGNDMERLKTEVEEELNVNIKFLTLTSEGTVFEASKKLVYEALRRSNKRYKRLTTRKQTITFTCAELKDMQDEIMELNREYTSCQEEHLKVVLSQIASYVDLFITLNVFISEQDVLSAFAELYKNPKDDNVFCIPEIVEFDTEDRSVLEIDGGWHLCIDKCVSNSVSFDSEDKTLYVITGANMGGKSTYIRQIGTCALLAHVGCPVPAKSCKLSLLSNICTRVGASDMQLKGVSTFMNEMLDTAHILSSIDKRSLLVIDELGRGTSIYEGLGLAQAITEHLIKQNGCFCLFATHFNELTNLEKKYKNAGNLYLEAIENKASLFFSYKVRQGSVSKSFGINLIERMGFPVEVVDEAKMVSERLESWE